MARYHLLAEPSAAKALTALNAGISTSGLGHRFVTYVIAILDAQAHTLTLANAGHLSPLLRDRSGVIQSIAETEAGYPLGVQPDYTYQQATVNFKPGDTLLLFTDGVTEAMNPKQEIYGVQRLMQYVSGAKGNIEELGEGLIANVEKFCEGGALRDDICVVAVRRSRST
jgi:sigma-B regulation protein RsbU (phosphoserine phosphatase)